MAKKKGSENRFPRLQLIEAPEDAGPAAAGMIEIRADEATKLPYVIDDAGDTTPLGAPVTLDYGETGDITTLDYDDAADAGVLAEIARADHRHGMPAEGGGGGGGGGTGARYPVQSAAGTSSNSNTRAVTIAAAASGNRLIVVTAMESTHAVSSIACTNVTFTKLAGTSIGVAPVIEIWVGVVAGGSSGTTVTVTFAGSNFCNAVVMEFTSLTGTLDTSASRNVTTDPAGTHVIPILTPGDAAALVVAAATTTNNSTTFSAYSGVYLIVPLTGTTLGVAYGFPGTNPVYGAMTGGSSATAAGLTASIL